MTIERNEVALNSERTNPALERQRASRTVIPAVDIYEDENGITLLADMPGVNREGLALNLEGDVLSIEGTLNLALPGELNPVYNEMNAERFARSFTLSKELDPNHIDAEIREGVLKVKIPKAETLKPRRIDVKLS